jgi:multidrug transporter EmrE-like cation transporter
MNVSIVLIASFIGLLIFQEKLSLKKGLGLIFSILAIMLLFLAS